MKILTESDCGIIGEKIICIFRKHQRPPALIHDTGGHRALQMWIKGLPAKAFIEKKFRFKK